MTCKRNAFVMLYNTNQARAVEYLNQVFSQVPSFDELLQLAVIQLIRKDCRTNAANKVIQGDRLLSIKLEHVTWKEVL